MSKGVPGSPFTDLHTDEHTDRVTAVDTLSGFQDSFLQSIRIGPTISEKYGQKHQ